MTDYHITDDSNDREYFILTPQLVWMLSRSPYDYTLWCVIKMIAGELGECWVNTDNLATLAMMSTGKVSDCRRYLLNKRLLTGKQKEVTSGQKVWHLKVPDLWEANIKAIRELGDFEAKLQLKKEQKLKKASLNESLHTVKPSPGETSKNHVLNTNTTNENDLLGKLLAHFLEISKLPAPRSEITKQTWLDDLADILKFCGDIETTKIVITKTIAALGGNYIIVGPHSIYQAAAAEWAKSQRPIAIKPEQRNNKSTGGKREKRQSITSERAKRELSEF